GTDRREAPRETPVEPRYPAPAPNAHASLVMSDPTPDPDRRGFLSWLLAAVPFAGGLYVVARSAASPARVERPERLPLCKKGDVPEQGILARPISYEARRGPVVETVNEVAFVTRDPASGEIFALSNRCTHVGCPVVLREPEDGATGEDAAPLHCPCHDGTFSATGEVVGGPPERPLERLTIEVPDDDDGTVWLV